MALSCGINNEAAGVTSTAPPLTATALEAVMAEITLHEDEEWRLVKDWPYEVSNLGRVRRTFSKYGRWSGRHLSLKSLNCGYPFVRLHHRCDVWQIHVHRLVCDAFHGPSPSDRHEVRHLDGTRDNNRADNLCWGTYEENKEDMRTHGTKCWGEKSGKAKFRNIDIIHIRSAYKNHKGSDRAFCRVTAEQYSVCEATILNILKRKTWGHLE